MAINIVAVTLVALFIAQLGFLVMKTSKGQLQKDNWLGLKTPLTTQNESNWNTPIKLRYQQLNLL